MKFSAAGVNDLHADGQQLQVSPFATDNHRTKMLVIVRCHGVDPCVVTSAKVAFCLGLSFGDLVLHLRVFAVCGAVVQR